ncbi:hypothetical protein J6590_042149 [Homalodisca vitripennis]|nr:hypothetical protein J6590_042149 [Homalodisca vitripennis]
MPFISRLTLREPHQIHQPFSAVNYCDLCTLVLQYFRLPTTVVPLRYAHEKDERDVRRLALWVNEFTHSTKKQYFSDPKIRHAPLVASILQCVFPRPDVNRIHLAEVERSGRLKAFEC